MPQKFTNNARAALVTGINSTDTSITIEATKGDLFPVANVGTGSIPSTLDWFKATLQDASGNVEIIYVRTRALGSAIFSNVMRGQEGTTARAFVSNTIVGLRVTAADLNEALAPLADGSVTTAKLATATTDLINSKADAASTTAALNNTVNLTAAQTVGGTKTLTSTLLLANAGFKFAGDTDSGVELVSDGVWRLMVNNAEIARYSGTASRSYTQMQVFNPNAGNWDSRNMLIEHTGGSEPAIGFHAPNTTTAGILKFYGPTSAFEFRNSNDSGFVGIRADYLLFSDGTVINSTPAFRPGTSTWLPVAGLSQNNSAPAGGTWAYFYGSGTGVNAGFIAGGQALPAIGSSNGWGFIWRVS